MHSLVWRIQELKGLPIRLHIIKGPVSSVDGVCRGIENDAVILSPSSLGEQTKVALEDIAAVTQLVGLQEWETDAEEGDSHSEQR